MLRYARCAVLLPLRCAVSQWCQQGGCSCVGSPCCLPICMVIIAADRHSSDAERTRGMLLAATVACTCPPCQLSLHHLSFTHLPAYLPPYAQDECVFFVPGQSSGRRTLTYNKLCVPQRFGYLAFDKYDD